MNKLLLALMAMLVLASCGGVKYDVSGSSSDPRFDGKKLYLKIAKDGDVVNIDSCEVVHGSFRFSGSVDSVTIALLYMDDLNLNLPIVLEQGSANVVINDHEQTVKGTSLNEVLYAYLDKRRQFQNEINELPRKQSQMIMDGIDEYEIQLQLTDVQNRLYYQVDSLDTHFVKDNFENVLGPSMFIMTIVNANRYPVLTPQIEDILSSAPQSFKDNPQVKEFLELAEETKKQLQYVPGTATEEAVADKKKEEAKK